MKRLSVLLFVSILFLGCNNNGEVIPDGSNIVPYGHYVTANTDYVNVFILEPGAYFRIQSVSRFVLINGSDAVSFTASYAFGNMEISVIISIGDAPGGYEFTLFYNGYEQIDYEVL